MKMRWRRWGVIETSGPLPKRSEERRRRNKPEGVQVTKGEMMPVTWDLEPDPDWHPIAIRLYESVGTSGQSRFYQDSDWALLYSICDDLSHYKNSYKRSGQMLQSIMSSLQDLAVSEGARRRIRIELVEPAAENDAPAEVAIMDDYRQGLAQGSK